MTADDKMPTHFLNRRANARGTETKLRAAVLERVTGTQLTVNAAPEYFVGHAGERPRKSPGCRAMGRCPAGRSAGPLPRGRKRPWRNARARADATTDPL